jgi:hypothetical protein
MKLIEDNTGFVNFPIPGKVIDRIDGLKTFIYLVAFETLDLTNIPYILSNCRLNLQGTLISDDITFRKRFSHNTLDEIVEEQLDNNEFENRYFPNNDGEIQSSIPLTTCICLGWCENTFEFKDGNQWVCTFRDLTHEGQKLYYSIKKLHNNKEVRILTFNNI